MDPRAETLLQALDMVVILVSPDGEILFSNGAAERLMGRDLHGARMRMQEFTDASSLSMSVAEVYERLTDEAVLGELIADGTGEDARFYWMSMTHTEEPRAGRLVTVLDVSDALTSSGPLSRVLSQVSHDLRSPLTSVVGAAELLLSGRTGELGDAHRRMVNIIDEGARKMNTILESAKGRFSAQTAQAGKEES